MGWIVAIWIKLARLIGEKGDLTTKMKYRMTKKKNFGPRGVWAPLGPYLGLSLICVCVCVCVEGRGHKKIDHCKHYYHFDIFRLND